MSLKLGNLFKLSYTLPLFVSISAHALVDYSEYAESVSSASAAPSRSAAPAPSAGPVNRSAGVMSSSGPSYRPSGMFRFNSSYETLTVETTKGDSKVNFYNFDGHVDLPYELYIDMSYYMARAGDYKMTETTSTQNGNIQAKLGVRWLEFGSGHNRSAVDFLVGGVFAEKSDFATSRSDKIFALETTKILGVLGLGLGYEVRLTGTPDKDTEVDVGTIQKMSAMVAMQLTGDIRLSVEGNYYNIGMGEPNGDRPYLSKKVSFGVLNPNLNLSISPMVDLSLGGSFRSKRATNQEELADAGLWYQRGIFGNSVHAGLNINL
jgi:hypothetical protein